MTALAMSHYFGWIVCAGFFAADVYLYIKRQINWAAFISYLLPGALSLFWLFVVFKATKEQNCQDAQN